MLLTHSLGSVIALDWLANAGGPQRHDKVDLITIYLRDLPGWMLQLFVSSVWFSVVLLR